MIVDLSIVYGIFAAILIASGFFLYVGTIGRPFLKGEKKEDQLSKEDEEPPR